MKQAYLGIDVGSISTKGVIIDDDNQILSSSYIWTEGDPIGAVKRLLRLLVENRGQTLSRAMLVDRIWTDGAEYVDENALSVTVKRLRDKLEDTPSSPQYLKTVYGIGYTWAVK